MRLRMFRLFLLLLLAGVLFAGGMKDTLRVAAEPSDTRDDGEEDEYDKAARSWSAGDRTRWMRSNP